MNELKDKVAIVTGAAGGIGAATARLFAERGASVMLVDREEGPLHALAEDIGGERVALHAADVADERASQAFVEATVDRFGRLDILFANAGVEGDVAPLTEYDVGAFDRVIRVNLRGVFLGIKHAAPHLIRGGGGSIVITSSVAGVIGFPGLAPYVASKHAIIGLMKSAAVELAPRGIRVNTLNPGPIDNRMMRSVERQIAPDSPPSAKAQFVANVPVGRYGTNEEMAQVALFLASDASSYCTGAVFLADGGFAAQ